MKINEIQDLIKFVAKAGVNEVEIEQKDFKIVIKSDYLAKKKTNFKEETTIVQQQIPVGMNPPVAASPAPTPIASAAPSAAPAKEEPKETEDSNLITIKAQMLGTFYRAPGPDKDPFIQVGSIIKPINAFALAGTRLSICCQRDLSKNLKSLLNAATLYAPLNFLKYAS